MNGAGVEGRVPGVPQVRRVVVVVVVVLIGMCCWGGARMNRFWSVGLEIWWWDGCGSARVVVVRRRRVRRRVVRWVERGGVGCIVALFR